MPLTLVPQGCCENMISAIRNLVCPLCGASMLGFRCLGHCRSNWQTEWDFAMLTSRRMAGSSEDGSSNVPIVPDESLA